MKKIFAGLVGIVLFLVLVLGVMSLLAPSDFAVEREVVINRPKGEVFDYLLLVKNQNDWSPWIKKDPKLRQTFIGTDGEVGFVYKWDSDNSEVGQGEQEIMKIVDGERIDTKLRFKKPFESTSDGYFITEEVAEDKTKVKWGFGGSMPRPINIMFLFMDFDAEAGKEFDDGLKALKAKLEE